MSLFSFTCNYLFVSLRFGLLISKQNVLKKQTTENLSHAFLSSVMRIE